MMPQELIQMAPNTLIVLRTGVPSIRGDKVVYWRERAFTRRVTTTPVVPVHAGFGRTGDVTAAPAPLTTAGPASANDPLTLDLVIPALEAAGFEPLPTHGASDEAVEAWVERFIDASARPGLQEVDHAR